ncbi:phytanoyl-CoA dioxygenase family protein, partial [Candidatus Sumerlaeota bacterium]|nr:phytanoyl-CoA dioxygenase family protein [Candidatus Sumerlaeota bacterium]
VSAADAAILEKWVKDGYCTISGIVSLSDIDGMMREIDEIWTSEKPIPNLHILGAQLDPGDPASLPHDQLIRLDPEKKKKLRDASPWRIHNFHLLSDYARRIHDNAELIRLNSLIFGRDAVPRATINFMYGSRQHLHQDMTVFFVHPQNFLIGAWLACEDISPESGPLVYYPGSHKEPMFEKFDNYPQTSLKTCSPEVRRDYEAYLEATAQKYERKQFLARKGDVLLWHGMLIHGGDTVRNPALTRRSYVCHYIPDGMERDKEIAGPFNW